MKTKHLLLGILLILLIGAAVLVQADSPRNFRAHMSGSENVPVANTQAQGEAIFQLSKDGTSMHYKLIVANLADATKSHIHCGVVGQNGSVGVTLFSSATPVTVNGILVEGVFTGPDPGNGCHWNSLADVVAAIQSGGAYVNVHTTAYPTGEIRGQIH